MTRLTEDMIVARTRVSDMNQVKKLNCWGAELSDVSVLRKLKNVEVLSLSVNNIASLEDISFCRNLQELYIRKNKVPDISEICWLKELPKLKNLWLEENPCSEGGAELYRLTVIKTLPHLQKLDNSQVTSEEMADAMRRGLDIAHPMEGGGSSQPVNFNNHRESPPHQEVIERKSSRQNQYYEQEPERKENIQSPSRRVSNQVFEESRMSYAQSRSSVYEDDIVEESQIRRSASVQEMSPMLRGGGGPDEDLRRMSIREEPRYSSQDGYRPQRSSMSGPSPDGYRGYQESRYSQERSSYGNGYQEYRGVQLMVEEGSNSSSGGPSLSPLDDTPSRGPRSNPQVNGKEDTRNSPRQMSQAELHAVVNHHYNSTYRQVDQQLDSAQQLLAQRRSNSPPQSRPYPVRPKNRNSNVLSAILCLIKEIDGPSLEVVEMAVRCRMEELED